MPATDGLQPPLDKSEREIRKAYGGWTNFMFSYGLKPWDDDDAAEGKAIISGLARQEEYNAAEETNKTDGNASRG